MKQTDDFVNLEAGLIARAFVGTNNIDSIGYCHKDEKHYILRTDGLVIYTTFPDQWRDDIGLGRAPKGYFEKVWGMEEFNFDELDDIMEIVSA